jgi:hypothetical protein
MQKINMGKVVLGGIAAGIVLNIIDYLVNGVWLAAQWAEAGKKLNTGVDAMGGSAIAAYVVGDFLFAILIVWLYAAIRSRFGAGKGTAVKAALFVWVLGAIIAGQFVILGVYPGQLVATSSIGTLVGMIAGAYVGGMIYTENA